MSKWLGNVTEDSTIYFKFSTKNLSQEPTTLDGTPVLKVYKDNSTSTESTAGITLNVDFDSVTGLNNVTIDTSSDAFYAVGSDYQVIITTGTVDSISVVGTVVREFSIENRFDEVDVTKISGDSTAADNCELDYDGTGYDKAASTIGTCTENTDMNNLSASDILTTALTESYASDGSAGTLTQILYLIQQSLTEFTNVDTTKTVKKVDGATSAATFTYDDADAPTSITRDA